MINEPTTDKMREKIAALTAANQQRASAALQQAQVHYDAADRVEAERRAAAGDAV